MQGKSIIAMFAALWSCATIGVVHAVPNPAPNGAGPAAAKKAVSAKAGNKTKRKGAARTRKGGQADADPDAEVIAQMLSADSKSPLWSGRPAGKP